MSDAALPQEIKADADEGGGGKGLSRVGQNKALKNSGRKNGGSVLEGNALEKEMSTRWF